MAEQLETAIVMGRFRPRERLTELELCRRFSVSRNRVREALRILSGKGLVSLARARGAIVADYTPKEVREIYEVRQILEVAAVESAARRVTPKDVRALRTLARQFAKAVAKGEFAALRQANDAFHRYIHAMSGNDRLAKLIDHLWLQSHLVRHFTWLNPERLRSSVAEHYAIVDALDNGDREAVVRIYKRHMLGGRETYLRLIEGTGPAGLPLASAWAEQRAT